MQIQMAILQFFIINIFRQAPFEKLHDLVSLCYISSHRHLNFLAFCGQVEQQVGTRTYFAFTNNKNNLGYTIN